jgi:HlyD family secretion protein
MENPDGGEGMKKALIVLPVLILAGAAAVVIYQRATSEAEAPPGIIRVSGAIELTDVALGFKMAGRVETRPAAEGMQLSAGDLVARLESQDLAQNVALREAEVAAAQAQLAELLAGSRPEEKAEAAAAVEQARARLRELEAGSREAEKAEARASLERAKAEAERLALEFERQKRLFAERVVSAESYQAAQAGYIAAQTQAREAEARLNLVLEGPREEQKEQARAALHQAQERAALVEKGPREETVAIARARLAQTQAQLRIEQIRLGYATLRAPFGATVLSENLEAGEYALPGVPVVTIGDLNKVWLRAYINETDLGRIRLGQPVDVTTDTWPDKVYKGRITFISAEAEFTPKNVQTHKERVKLVYRVKIDVENPNEELKPGMPADGAIHVGR